MRVCESRLRVRRVRVVVSRTAASLRGKVEGSNIMLAIAACSDVLETVSIPILPLDDLPHVLSTVVCFASLIDVNVLCAGAPATQS